MLLFLMAFFHRNTYKAIWREEISRPGNFLLLTPEGNSVIDNEYIGFAFDACDTTKYSQIFWRKATGII